MFKSIKFYMQTWLGGLTHISMQNFVKIGRSIVEIENFQIFKMAAAAILEISPS